MMFQKCPRCDLNYITASEKYCKVCMREMKGGSGHDEIEMCSVCSENPVLPGRDICLFCLKELSNQASSNANHDDTNDSEEQVNTRALTDLDDVSSMDEIPEVDNDIPAGEFEKMAGEISSLESMREEEDQEDDEEDEEDM
ncbi:MAG: hypothetical protein PUC00_09865 [Clostridiales bacterium]|nr:hypothetical protein [Clostridiales bacterium]